MPKRHPHVRATALREAFALASPPYDAFISLDAIGRTAVRVLVTDGSCHGEPPAMPIAPLDRI